MSTSATPENNQQYTPVTAEKKAEEKPVPQPVSATAETQLLARQLLRFSKVVHPNTQAIKPCDLDYARTVLFGSAAPTKAETQLKGRDIIEYPLEWVESKTKFRNTFLKNWRKRFAQPRSPTPDFDPDEEESSPESVVVPDTAPLLRSPFHVKRIGPLNFDAKHLRPSKSHQRGNSDPETPQRAAQIPQLEPLTPSRQRQPTLYDPPTVGRRPSESLTAALEALRLETQQSDAADFLYHDARKLNRGNIFGYPEHQRQSTDSSSTTDPSVYVEANEEFSHSSTVSTASTEHLSTTSTVRPADSVSQTGSTESSELEPPGPAPPGPAPPGPAPEAVVQSRESTSSPSIELGRAQTRSMASRNDNPQPPAALTRDDIRAMFQELIQAEREFRNNNHNNRNRGNGNEDDPPEVKTGPLTPEMIGHFDPDKSDPLNTGMVAEGKYVVYTDIFAFTERLREVARARGKDPVKAVWSQCMKNNAQLWLTELLEGDWDAIGMGDVEYLCKRLIKHFKPKPAQVLQNLKVKKFTIHNIRAGQRLRPFANGIIRDAKALDLPLRNQLDYVFEALGWEIQAQLKKPTDTMTLQEFMDQLDDRESILQKEASVTLKPWNPAAHGKQNSPAPNRPVQNRANTPVYPQRQPGFRPPQNRQQTPQPQGGQAPFFRPSPHTQFLPLTQQAPQRYQNNNAQYPPNNAQYPANNGQQPYRPPPAAQQPYRQSPAPRQNAPPPGQAPQYNQQRPQGQPPPYKPQFQKAWYGGEADDQQEIPQDLTYDNGYQQYDNGYQEQEQEEHQEGYWYNEVDPYSTQYETPEPPQVDNTDQNDSEMANFGAQTQKQNVICKVCQASFTSRNRMFAHIRKSHNTTALFNTETSTPNVPFTKPKPDSGEGANIVVEVNPILAEMHHADDRMKMSSILNDQHVPNVNPADLFSHPPATKSQVPVVDSDVDSGPDVGTGFTYKTRTYLKLFLMTSIDSEHEEDVCGDTGCTRTLADKSWIQKHYPSAEIRQRASPMFIKGIAENQIVATEYAIIRFYFKGLRDGRPAVASFLREVTLVSGLPAHMLVGTDILDAERIDIILSRKIAIVQSCKVTIPISVTPDHRSQDRARVLVADDTKVPAFAHQYVDVVHKARFGQDCFFEPVTDEISCYALLTDDRMHQIIVRNDTPCPVVLTKNALMGHLVPMDQGIHGFHVTDDRAAELAIRKPPKKDESERRIIGSSTDFVAAHTPDSEKHPIGATIYKGSSDPQAFQRLHDIISEFADVFVDKGFANVPEEELLKFNFKPGWETRIPKKCRHYVVNREDQGVIDDTTAKLMGQKRLFRTRQPVPFSMPVFVVWRNVPKPKTETKSSPAPAAPQAPGQAQSSKDKVEMIRKGRMVVDTRPFNEMNLNDAYPMKSQEAMLAKISGMPFITVLDAMSFYYQWRVHPSTRWALTITTAKGQFTFNCLVMGYKNSNAYVQRQMDIILEPVEAADCYCDDICIASPTLEDHIRDLVQVFTILRQKNISIGASKSFIGFPNAVVLGRLVDSFGLSTTKERLAAISALQFPQTLKDLEHFIGLANYMRSNVPRYAQLAEPLEKRKQFLLRSNARRGNSKQGRKRWASSVAVPEPTDAELASFEGIKDALTKHTTLAYFNPKRMLFIDFDVSKDGIGVTVYHVKDEALPKIMKNGKVFTYPARTAIEPIAFLSRVLSNAEKNYWPTEMEVLGLVWMLRKNEHWIIVAESGVVTFTDHKAILGMTKHTDLVNSTALSNKNLRLVRALEYISKFEISILHKPGKLHIVPDALSRLRTSTTDQDVDAPGGLDVLPDDTDEHWSLSAEADIDPWLSFEDALPAIRLAARGPDDRTGAQPSSKGVSLVQLEPQFKIKMREGYLTDPKWRSILNVVTANIRLGDNAAELPYHLRDGLLWKKSETLDRLCVPRTCFPEVFEYLHGPSHLGLDRLRDHLLQFVIDRKEFGRYLRSCPECAVMRQRNHRPYGSMQPIIGPPCPFHTITIDIAFGLPESSGKRNALGVCVCKFSKAANLFPGRHDWTAEQWAEAFFNALLYTNWGPPKVLISDRDPKFLADFWKKFWELWGSKLFYATAYHPQTDGQTERYILYVKSTLRYYFHSLEDNTKWESCLPRLQYEMNSTRSSTTGVSPLEAVYGFTPNFVPHVQGAERSQLPPARIAVHDAITFASMTAKKFYDQRHQPMFFSVGQKVLLRLHKGYNIPAAAVLGRKLGQQYAGPFEITERVGRLAYRLNFPQYWRIHDVISVDHLEPAPPMDVFGRLLPHAGEVQPEDHQRRIIQADEVRERFLVEFDGLGPEYTRWYTKRQLGEEGENLIREYRMRRGQN